MVATSDEKSSILKACEDNPQESVHNCHVVLSSIPGNDGDANESNESTETKRVDVIPDATVSNKKNQPVTVVSEEPTNTVIDTEQIRLFITLDCCPCSGSSPSSCSGSSLCPGSSLCVCEEPDNECAKNKKECSECECACCNKSCFNRHFPCVSRFFDLSHLCECFAQTHPR
jgi:hypothetical protein